MPNLNVNLNGQNFRSVVDVSHLIASDGKLPKQIQVLPVGEWMTLPYGPMKIDEGVITQMCANFNADIRKKVPIDVDHDGGKAAGWINQLIDKGKEGLWAVVEWTKYGKELLSEKIYCLFSPEWSFDYVDPEKSTHHGAVLIAGSLTNRPLFKELPILVASDGMGKKVEDFTKSDTIVLLLNSEGNKIMPTIEDILKKAVADRSVEEVQFLKDHEAELNDKQKAQVETENKPVETEEQKAARELKEKEDADKAKADADAVKTPEQIEAEKVEAAKVEADKVEAAKVEAEKVEADKTADDKTVTLKASEVKAMQDKIAEFTAAERKNAIEKDVTALVANENGGKILLKAKESVVNFLLTCNDTQKASFMELMKEMPEIKVTGQQSVTASENLGPAEQINKLAEDKVKASEGKLSITDAILKVIAENPVLANEYNKDIKSSKK